MNSAIEVLGAKTAESRRAIRQNAEVKNTGGLMVERLVVGSGGFSLVSGTLITGERGGGPSVAPFMVEGFADLLIE